MGPIGTKEREQTQRVKVAGNVRCFEGGFSAEVDNGVQLSQQVYKAAPQYIPIPSLITISHIDPDRIPRRIILEKPSRIKCFIHLSQP